MSTALAAARQGDRHSHAANTSDRDAGALLSVAASALVSAVSLGGVAVSMIGAGVASGGGGHITTRDVIPFDTSGSVANGSVRTFLGAARLAAALAGAEPLDCSHHRGGPIRMGSATVFVDGRSFARQTDQTSCGSILSDGDATILVGGAPFDGAPPNPLAALTTVPALASVVVGAALAVGASAVATAQRWGETLLGEAAAIADEAQTTLQQTAGALAADVGTLVGTIDEGVDGVLGPLLGLDLGDIGHALE
ncbi:colicin/pyosin nuclease family protein [Minicystis rosea]|nr:colicin/pyosin nuclease family protein [Minicystis rosea]